MEKLWSPEKENTTPKIFIFKDVLFYELEERPDLFVRKVANELRVSVQSVAVHKEGRQIYFSELEHEEIEGKNNRTLMSNI